TDIVNSEGHGSQRYGVTGHVERCEVAVAPYEAVTILAAIPVGSHNLAFRVDEAALRSDICRVELDEIAVVIEKGVERRPNGVSSHEQARRIDSVDEGTRHAGVKCVGHVNRGENAISQHEAMSPFCIIKLSCDRVRAIPVDCSCGRV